MTSLPGGPGGSSAPRARGARPATASLPLQTHAPCQKDACRDGDSSRRQRTTHGAASQQVWLEHECLSGRIHMTHKSKRFKKAPARDQAQEDREELS